MKSNHLRINRLCLATALGSTACIQITFAQAIVAQERCECKTHTGLGRDNPNEYSAGNNLVDRFDESESSIENEELGLQVRQTVQRTELRIAAIGNSLGVLTPWNPKKPANIVEDTLLVALADPFPEGDLLAELDGYGEVLGVALEVGVFRFDLKSQLTPGLHRIRLRLNHPQNEPHSAWVSRPFWVAFKHSAPNDPAIRNLPALARKTLTSTAKQQFELEHSATLESLNYLLKHPFDDACLSSKVESVLGNRRTHEDPCSVDYYPVPPAVPYCGCLVPCAECNHGVAPSVPEPPLSAEESKSEGGSPASQGPLPEPKKEDSPQDSRTDLNERNGLLVATTQRPSHSKLQTTSSFEEPVTALPLLSDAAAKSNQLLVELDHLQVRSDKACSIARYLEAQEFLQEKTLNCLKSHKVVSTVEFDSPAIFSGNTFSGDRMGGVVGDLTILEGMKLDVYGDGRYALKFQYLRPSRPVKLHLQLQCWIDDDFGWKSLTLAPISIDPGNWDPSKPVKEYSFSGHSRALERSNGYLQKVRRTGSASVGFGLYSPSDLRDY